jgi:hypothetical protein
MNTKFRFLTLMILAAFVLSACASAGQPGPENLRSLSVNGNARVTAAPDIAYITIGARSESAEAAEAVTSNTAQVEAIIAALGAMGVEPKDIQTSGFNIYPQDEWGPDGQRTGVRYVVENTLYVTVRDLEKIGELLGAAVDAGANTIYGISFDIEDKEALIAQARAQAVENARKQAEELAKAAGVELGEIQSISYYNSYPAPFLDNKGGYGGGAAVEAVAAVPVSPGQLTITADVSVSYLLK